MNRAKHQAISVYARHEFITIFPCVCMFAPVVAECFLCANGLAREDSFFFFSSISIQKIQTLSSIDCCAWKKKGIDEE